MLFIRQNALFQNISLTLAGLNVVKDEFQYHILVEDEKLNRLEYLSQIANSLVRSQ